MMKYRTSVCIVALFVLAGSAAGHERRKAFQADPAGRDDAGAAHRGRSDHVRAARLGSRILRRGQDAGQSVQPLVAQRRARRPAAACGQYLRFRSSIPPRLRRNSLFLVTARQWDAQYEWHAHHRLALQAGLNPAVAADLAEGKRPAGMQEDETIVYNFCRELHQERKVSDATYKAALDKFGERGVMDLIAVSGYYVLVSMTLNVDRTPVPGDGKPPLRPLPR